MGGSRQEGRPIRITVDAIYEAGVLKLLTPLPAVPEHTKVRVTVEACPAADAPPSVIDAQRQHRLALAAPVVRAIGDGHAYDLFKS